MPSTSGLALAQTMRREKNRLLLSELRYNSVQNILVSGIFACFFSQIADSSRLWYWWAGFAIVAAARAGILRWLEVADGLDESRRSTAIYTCIGATALAWGVAPLACGSAGPELSFILAVSWVMVIVIGGANAFQADTAATAALALPATVPALVVLITAPDRISFTIAAAIGLVYAHLAAGNARARRTRAVELRLQNENAQLMQKYQKRARLASEELDRRVHLEHELRTARHLAERLASLDGLTGIANRRYFDEQLNAEIARGFRGRKPVSVVLMDIDCFKQFNDSFGHGAGDDCLAEIGKILTGFARRGGDLAARYGGEEFVLLLPGSDAAAAARIAENVRAAIFAREIAHGASDIAPYVTASFGVATVTPTIDDTARQLVEAADKALYEAKKAGRNRVISAA